MHSAHIPKLADEQWHITSISSSTAILPSRALLVSSRNLRASSKTLNTADASTLCSCYAVRAIPRDFGLRIDSSSPFVVYGFRLFGKTPTKPNLIFEITDKRELLDNSINIRTASIMLLNRSVRNSLPTAMRTEKAGVHQMHRFCSLAAALFVV